MRSDSYTPRHGAARHARKRTGLSAVRRPVVGGAIAVAMLGSVGATVAIGDLDAAIEFSNGSRYGNAGSIFTTSGEVARAYRWGIEAGMLGVNIGVPAPVAWFPFSGWKDSIDGDLHAHWRVSADRLRAALVEKASA